MANTKVKQNVTELLVSLSLQCTRADRSGLPIILFSALLFQLNHINKFNRDSIRLTEVFEMDLSAGTSFSQFQLISLRHREGLTVAVICSHFKMPHRFTSI